MTFWGSVSRVGQGVQIAQGQVKELATLAEKFKLALQQKEPKELGRILAQVKGLGVKAEKAFLAAAVKTEGNTLSAAATLKEAVFANLSVEQRAELAKELFSIKGFKSNFLGKASLQLKLAKYLGKMGQEKLAVEAPKDEMVRGAAATVFQTASAMGVSGQGEAKVLPEGGRRGDAPRWIPTHKPLPLLDQTGPSRPRLEPKTPEER